MATQTPNLNLILPDYADKADIGVVNDNFKKIDDFSGGGKVEEWLDSIQKKADESLAKINQDATSYLNNIQKEANESLNEIENKAKNSLESIPDDYEVLVGEVDSLKDQKANVIIDTSARMAVSHELPAQDGSFDVTLYGKTNETGSGDKSPDNPYVIGGVGLAHFTFNGSENWVKSSLSVQGHSSFYLNDSRFVSGRVFVISDTFRRGTYAEWTELVQDEFIEVANKTIGIRVKSERATDLASWKAWLASNPVNAWSQIQNGEPVDSVGADLAWDGGYKAIVMPLLPDNTPLMGNGTVDDTIENDVLSGCDVKVTFDGSDDEGWWMDAAGVFKRVGAIHPYSDSQHQYSNRIPFAGTHASANPRFKITGAGEVYIVNSAYSDVSELIAALAANPLTVFYRSTDYTPENDLRVCKVVRKMKHLTLNGTQASAGWYTNYVCFSAPGVKAGGVITSTYLPSGNTGVTTQDTYPNTVCIRRTGGSAFDGMTFEEVSTYFASKPLDVYYELSTPETYMTESQALRKEDAPNTNAVIVKGVGDMSVKYPCDTKTYIDRKFDALAAALLS